MATLIVDRCCNHKAIKFWHGKRPAVLFSPLSSEEFFFLNANPFWMARDALELSDPQIIFQIAAAQADI